MNHRIIPQTWKVLIGLTAMATGALAADTWTNWVHVSGVSNACGSTVDVAIKHDGNWRPGTHYGLTDLPSHASAYGYLCGGLPYMPREADRSRGILVSRIGSALEAADNRSSGSFLPALKNDNELFTYTVNSTIYSRIVNWSETSPGVWRGRMFTWLSQWDVWNNQPGTPWPSWTTIGQYHDLATRRDCFRTALRKSVYQIERSDTEMQSPALDLVEDERLKSLSDALDHLQTIADADQRLKFADAEAVIATWKDLIRNGLSPLLPKASRDDFLKKLRDAQQTLESDDGLKTELGQYIGVSNLNSLKCLDDLINGLTVINAVFTGLSIGDNVGRAYYFNSVYASLHGAPEVSERVDVLRGLQSLANSYDPALALAIQDEIQLYDSNADTNSIIATFTNLPSEARAELINSILTGARVVLDAGMSVATKHALLGVSSISIVGLAVFDVYLLGEVIDGIIDRFGDSQMFMEGNACLSFDQFLAEQLSSQASTNAIGYPTLSEGVAKSMAAMSSMGSYSAREAVSSYKTATQRSGLVGFAQWIFGGLYDDTSYQNALGNLMVDLLDGGQGFLRNAYWDNAAVVVRSSNGSIIGLSVPYRVYSGLLPYGFTAPVTPTVAANVSPTSITRGGGSILFQGSYSDPDNFNGGVTETWKWQSSIDGTLGTQPNITVSSSALSVGTHTITFTYTDNDGQSASASQSLQVLAPAADQGFDLALLSGWTISGGNTYFDISALKIKNVGSKPHTNFVLSAYLKKPDATVMASYFWTNSIQLAVNATSSIPTFRLTATAGYKGPATVELRVDTALDENRANNTASSGVNVGTLDYGAFSGRSWTVVNNNMVGIVSYGGYAVVGGSFSGSQYNLQLSKNGGPTFSTGMIPANQFALIDNGAAAVFAWGNSSRSYVAILLGSEGSLIVLSPTNMVVQEGQTLNFSGAMYNATQNGHEWSAPFLMLSQDGGGTVQPWFGDDGENFGDGRTDVNTRYLHLAPPLGAASGVYRTWIECGQYGMSMVVTTTTDNGDPGVRMVRTEVQVTPAPIGTISVSSTPSGGLFTLNGPTGFTYSGTTPWSSSTVSAPGQYAVTWGDNPGYLKPPGTNATLALKGTVAFSGTYVAANWTPGGLHISPSAPTRAAPLLAVVDIPSVDWQGGPVSYEYRWYKSGVVQTGLTNAIVSQTLLARGDSWKFDVRAVGGSPVRYSDWVTSPAVAVQNSAPVAQASVSTGFQEQPLLVPLTATDADADPLTFTVLTGPSVGTMTLSNAAATITPPSNWWGTVSFTFQASDGTDQSNLATNTIQIQHVNKAPVIAFASPTTNWLNLVAGQSESFSITATDVDSTNLQYCWYWNGVKTNIGATSFLLVSSSQDTNSLDAIVAEVSDGESTATRSWAVQIQNTNQEPLKQLSGIWVSNGLFRFVLNGHAGSNYTILVSANLRDWSALTTNTVPAGGWTTITDTNSPAHSSRFYRVGPQPPPGMVLVPAGSFQMGDNFGDGTGFEHPTHSVYVSTLYVDANLVSKAEWDQVYGWATNHGYSFDNVGLGKAEDHPVHTVSWHDVVKWCNARSRQEGLVPCYYTDVGLTVVYQGNQSAPYVRWNANGYRLPTEAEWEKSARGGVNGKRFPWGDEITHSNANYRSTTDYVYDISPTRGFHPIYGSGVSPYTSPVGSFTLNGYGLYDMTGNVFEWCWDWFGDWYGNAGASRDDTCGPDSSPWSYRVLRGGSWYNVAYTARCADRAFGAPTVTTDDLGFRCVRRP